MYRWFILLVLSVVLSGLSPVQASPYGLSGVWQMNANGWIFSLEIKENGNNFEGIMRPRNHQAYDTRVAGTVSADGKVEFLRYLGTNNVQNYAGYVFRGIEKNRGMAGVFSHHASQPFGWFAQRASEGNYVAQQQAYKLFAAVPSQSSANFKANAIQRFRVDTTSWDRVPYHITKAIHRQFTIAPGQHVFLSGDEAGTKNWGVDNFLFLEFRYGQSVQRYVIGEHEPVYLDGQRVQKIGPGSFNFAPNAVDFSLHLPTDTPIQLTAYALDYGGAGWVSNVYLLIK